MWGKNKTMKKEENRGMFSNLQHFRGKKACWSFGMGRRQIHKQEFKMRSTYITKKKRQLVQVKWKWCDGFSRDNLKHEFYTTHNLREEASLPPPIIYFVPLCKDYIQMSLFPQDSQMGVPKLGLLLSQNFGRSYLSQIKSIFGNGRAIFYSPQKKFPVVYNTTQLKFI
jgi:hypothetical protein